MPEHKTADRGQAMMEESRLKRSISLPYLVLYGMGTMVGAGFYALLGKVSAEAGMATPMAFLAAGVLALLTGFAFAELSSRYPYSAGEAHYVDAAFNSRGFSALIGYFVMLTGIVSAGTLVVATVGFFRDFVDVPQTPAVIVLALTLGAIAAWGISQSVIVITVITVLTIAGLGYVLLLTGDNLLSVTAHWPEIFTPGSVSTWIGILAGGFLAFYAFIGFEDMVNVAEEVRDVRSHLPAAILISVIATTAIYVVVATAAILTVEPSSLARANTPLARVVEGRGGWHSDTVIGLISLVAGINSAMVQIIMASRVGYGLARDRKLPPWLGAIHPRTRTPVRTTALITLVVLLLALFFPLTTLAKATSTIMLIVFASVSLALVWIKLREEARPAEAVTYPLILPVLGAAAALGVLLFHLPLGALGGGH